jgi:hypothetical protein
MGAVVLLFLLGFPAYVVLGALAEDDQTSSPDGAGDDESQRSRAFLKSIVEAANDKDVARLRDLACRMPGRNIKPAINHIGTTASWALTSSTLVSADQLDATVTISFRGAGTDEFHLLAVRDDGRWCWNDIVASQPSRPTPTPNPEVGKGVDFTKRMLQMLNDGDATGAKAHLCHDSTSQPDVDQAGRGHAELQIDAPEVVDTGDFIGADLKGTINGEPISAGRISGFIEEDGWCAYTIYVIP